MQLRQLKRKLDLYLDHKASPGTTKQIEEWLSDSSERAPFIPEQVLLEDKQLILDDIRDQTGYPYLFPSMNRRDKRNTLIVGAIACGVFLLILYLRRH